MGFKSLFNRLKTSFCNLSDKKQHFLVCLISSFCVGVMDPFAGFMVAMGLGFGKEFGDSRALANRWDWNDVLADFAGSVAGTAVSVLFRFLLGLLL